MRNVSMSFVSDNRSQSVVQPSELSMTAEPRTLDETIEKGDYKAMRA
jgi:hypothetical protein